MAVARVRAAYDRHPVPTAHERAGWLAAIANALRDRRTALFEAVRADLGKPEFETLLSELRLCEEEAALIDRKSTRLNSSQLFRSRCATVGRRCSRPCGPTSPSPSSRRC